MKKHWTFISATAALIFSTYTLLNDWYSSHDVSVVVDSANFDSDSPRLHLFLINKGKEQEIIFSVAPGIAWQQSDGFACSSYLKEYDPIILGPQAVQLISLTDPKVSITDLAKDIPLQEYGATIDFGLSITYLDSNNTISRSLVKLGTVSFDARTVSRIDLGNRETPISAISLEPQTPIKTALRRVGLLQRYGRNVVACR
jgi:hypothetical protein